MHSLHDVLVAVFAGGHFQLVSRFHALHAVVTARPIGHHYAVKAPFVAQNLAQKVHIFVGEHAVETIIRRHHRLGLSFLGRNLEARQINFPKRALVNDAVDHHAPLFLIIDGKML